MKRSDASDLSAALNEATNADSPMEAYQSLEQAVIDALGYSGVFRISRDEDPRDPRDGLNLSHLHLRMRSYAQLGDYDTPHPDEAYDVVVYRRTIYGYSHSGLVLSASEFNCNFDSGVAGYQYITKARLDAWGLDDTSPDKLKDICDVELKDYNRYLAGEGYWIVQVLGDDDRYAVEAETFDELRGDFDHEALHGNAKQTELAAACLEKAWERRNDLETL